MTYQTVLDRLMANGKISETTADRVFLLYRKLRVLKYNAHDGYQAVHGAIFDHNVIQRALGEKV